MAPEKKKGKRKRKEPKGEKKKGRPFAASFLTFFLGRAARKKKREGKEPTEKREEGRGYIRPLVG